jgi:hypothetical protein
MLLVHFAFMYLSDRILLFAQSALILLPLPPHSWDYRCDPPYPVCWDGVLLTFFLGLSWTAVLQISASQVVGITGMSHYAQAYTLNSYIFFFFLLNHCHHESNVSLS